MLKNSAGDWGFAGEILRTKSSSETEHRQSFAGDQRLRGVCEWSCVGDGDFADETEYRKNLVGGITQVKFHERIAQKKICKRNFTGTISQMKSPGRNRTAGYIGTIARSP